jgi:hypothetical protein
MRGAKERKIAVRSMCVRVHALARVRVCVWVAVGVWVRARASERMREIGRFPQWRPVA